MADEGDVAALLAARRRLADVVEEGAEAQRGAAGHLVGQGLGEQLRGLACALAGEALQVGLDLERVLEDGERVAVDVEVVVGSLPDPAQRLQLGQDDRGEAELVEQGEAAQRVGPADQLAQLGQLALPGGLGGAGGVGPGQGDGPGVDRQLELGRQARGAEQAQRVLVEAALADRAQEPSLEVGEAPVGVEWAAAGKGDRDSADGEVPRRQVGLDRLAAQRRGVDLPGAVGGHHPPGPELGRELEGVPAALPGDRLRRRRGVAR